MVNFFQNPFSSSVNVRTPVEELSTTRSLPRWPATHIVGGLQFVPVHSRSTLGRRRATPLVVPPSDWFLKNFFPRIDIPAVFHLHHLVDGGGHQGWRHGHGLSRTAGNSRKQGLKIRGGRGDLRHALRAHLRAAAFELRVLIRAGSRGWNGAVRRHAT